MTQSSTDSSLVERLLDAVVVTPHGKGLRMSLSADDVEAAASRISTLERELEEARAQSSHFHQAYVETDDNLIAAEAKVARMGDALAWSMDEIDILSNKMSGFAYPQGMVPARRRDQLDNYRKAVDARRSALQSEKDREGEDGR